MFVDARSVPTGTVIETEVCIVGGGAAGITLAREFTNASFRVILLESGGAEPEQATQDLYAGSDIGRPYDIFAASRLRYFGGTTNHWGGVWCDMPSSLDFETREGVPYSGWPFPLSYLEPWYRRAQPVLKLGPYGYALSDWGIAPSDIPEPFRGPHFVCRVLQQGPATRFGPEYGPELRRAQNLSVYLHANALRFDASENGGAVATAQCRRPSRWSLYSSGPHIHSCGRRNRKCAPAFAVRERGWRWPRKRARSRRSVLHAPFGILGRRHRSHRPICGFDVPNWRKRRTIQSAWRHSALCILHKPFRRNQAPTQVADFALALPIPQDPRGRCADAAHPSNRSRRRHSA